MTIGGQLSSLRRDAVARRSAPVRACPLRLARSNARECRRIHANAAIDGSRRSAGIEISRPGPLVACARFSRPRSSLRRVFAFEHLPHVAAIGDQPIETRLPAATAVAGQKWSSRRAAHCRAEFLWREPVREPNRASPEAFGSHRARRREFPALGLVDFKQLFGRTFGGVMLVRNLLGRSALELLMP